MQTIFSKIITGEIKCHKVAENENFLAFLDVFPLVPGHTLVIPKRETDYIFDLEDNDYISLMLFAKHVAIAVKKAFPCKKVGISVIGLEVAHAHVHLVPINQISDMNFSNEKLKPAVQELYDNAEKIRAFI